MSFDKTEASEIVQFRTQRVYKLSRLDDQLTVDADGLQQIADTCNQPTVYSMLFAEGLAGKPYELSAAERFVAWGRRGWQEGTHFVYVLTAPDGDAIVGALDIKSADTASAEIGYWLNSEHSGIMTNAVRELLDIARNAGYAALHAIVRVTNPRSARVILRAGFARTGSFEKNERQYDRFEIRLR